MTIGELAIGDVLYFGTTTPARNGEQVEPYTIIWKKASQDGDFISMFSEACLNFDAPENGNPNQHRAIRGNNCYPQSNIHQYLNSAERKWYTPSHEFDAPPIISSIPYIDKSGFLSCFDKWQIDLLVPREIVCLIPSGSKRSLGNSVTVTCLVSLPSTSELGIDVKHGNQEGDALELFRSGEIRTPLSPELHAYMLGKVSHARFNRGYWTRTANTLSDCSVCCIREDGVVGTENPGVPLYIRPVIRLPLDCELFANNNRFYEIIPPENECVKEDEFINVLSGK